MTRLIDMLTRLCKFVCPNILGLIVGSGHVIVTL